MNTENFSVNYPDIEKTIKAILYNNRTSNANNRTANALVFSSNRASIALVNACICEDALIYGIDIPVCVKINNISLNGNDLWSYVEAPSDCIEYWYCLLPSGIDLVVNKIGGKDFPQWVSSHENRLIVLVDSIISRVEAARATKFNIKVHSF